RLTLRRPPRSTLFPSTTLFRSECARAGDTRARAGAARTVVPRACGRPPAPRTLADDATLLLRPRDRRHRPPGGVDHRRHVDRPRSEEHTSELQSRENLVCRLLL